MLAQELMVLPRMPESPRGHSRSIMVVDPQTGPREARQCGGAGPRDMLHRPPVPQGPYLEGDPHKEGPRRGRLCR